jgi:DNA-binding transcriptional LysR family regulator
MNFNQLRAFYTVAKTGAFSKAAQELLVTEPAVLIQVKTLERYLGCKLLDRFGKDWRTTEAGRILYDYAERIFGLVTDVDRQVKELQALKSGELRIGSVKALAQYLMPRLVSSFQIAHPTIRLLLSDGNSEELVKGVLDHQFELALVARIPYDDRISALPFSRERIVVVISPESELSNREDVSLEELNEYPVICRDGGSATSLAMRTIFAQHGLNPSSVIESANTEFIKDMIKQRRGYSFVSAICVRKEIDWGELATVPLKGGDMEIEIDIIRLKDKALSPAASAFVNFLRERSDPENLVRMADRMGEWGIGPLPAASQQAKERLHLVEGSAAPKPAYL